MTTGVSVVVGDATTNTPIEVWFDDSLAELARSVGVAFGVQGRRSTGAAAWLRVERRHGGMLALVSQDATVVASAPEIIDRIVGKLNLASIERSSHPLHIHAGGAVFGGAAVVFPGASGSGKSTLVAAAATRGWSVLSDESIWFDLRGRVGGLLRPISVRDGSRSVVAVPDGAWPRGSDSSYVPVSAFGQHVDSAALAAVVLPKYSAGAAVAVRSVGIVDVVAATLSQVLDAGKSGARLLETMVSAFDVPAFALDYGDANEAVRVVESVVDDLRRRDIDAAGRAAESSMLCLRSEVSEAQADPHRQVGPRVPVGLAPDTVVYVRGDDAVSYAAASRAVARVRGLAPDVFRSLAGGASAVELARQMGDVSTARGRRALVDTIDTLRRLVDEGVLVPLRSPT